MKKIMYLLPVVVATVFALPAMAEDTVLPQVTVTDNDETTPPPSNDVAKMLMHHAGFGVAAGGGISGLPILNGMADDRLNVRFDGMEIQAACANHMNSPLSYVHPSQVSAIDMIAGIASVSRGGDNIGGVIDVKSKDPVFAQDDKLYKAGRLAMAYRSVNNELSESASAAVANQSLSLSVDASHAKANSYKDGRGDKIRGSMYSSNNVSTTIAAKGDDQELIVRLGQQVVPRQGFPNQYMDMTHNHGQYANVEYRRQYDWGDINAKAYWQETNHEMGFFTPERTGQMPMLTKGMNRGYELKATVNADTQNTFRFGHEYHSFTLNDYWPAVPGSMMMGPNNFVNINDGKRQRIALFGEWEHQLNKQVKTIIGVRDEYVQMNAGNVQGYNTMGINQTAAQAFNAADKKRHDNNIDMTALLRYEPDATADYELGFARKNRSPNLYERYSWGRSTMAMTMVNWTGDGNGYVGNINLKPETAYTLSAAADWHDADGSWFLRVSPYLTYVQNYIDADVVGDFHPYMNSAANAKLLQFANHDARLYGVNITWLLPVAQTTDWGDFDVQGKLSSTFGQRTDGERLYRMMPWVNSWKLMQHAGAWHNELETVITAKKHLVSANRLEPKTSSYTLVNWKTVYQVNKNMQVSMGISNLFNRYYDDPLGGVNVASLGMKDTNQLTPLAGYGRSFDIGMSIDF